MTNKLISIVCGERQCLIIKSGIAARMEAYSKQGNHASPSEWIEWMISTYVIFRGYIRPSINISKISASRARALQKEQKELRDICASKRTIKLIYLMCCVQFFFTKASDFHSLWIAKWPLCQFSMKLTHFLVNSGSIPGLFEEIFTFYSGYWKTLQIFNWVRFISNHAWIMILIGNWIGSHWTSKTISM